MSMTKVQVQSSVNPSLLVDREVPTMPQPAGGDAVPAPVKANDPAATFTKLGA